MIRSFIINKYLAKEFLKIVTNASLILLCVGFVLSLFEEINFFKDYGIGIKIPLLLSSLFVPSLFTEMFPFVILLSGIWFFLRIKKTDEIVPIKTSGMSNFSIIIIPSIISIILGIIFITSFNPITSALVKKYETIKGGYEKDKDYLAAITVNGIWIKEKNLNINSLIRASNLDGKKLINVTIYEFDQQNNFLRTIQSQSANIISNDWILNNTTVFDSNGKKIFENKNNVIYKSIYDLGKIKSLYSNLNTISFWRLKEEIKILEARGYSTKEVNSKFHRSLAFPFFLLSMILLSGVFTLGNQAKENNWRYVFIAIISSVLIHYFNDFSAALGKTDKLPIQISVWMPIVIIFIFGTVGLIYAEQK